MSKLLDPESFAAHVEAATRQAGFEVEKRDGLDLYVILVQRDATERDHPLCAELLLWQEGRIREYHPKQ